MPLKERIILFYPNVTLCDESCNNIGVNLTSMKAICECKLKEFLNEAKDATRLIGLEFADLIDSISIDVLKCFKTVFQYEYFINCYGGFISLFLIIIQSICVIIFFKKSKNKLGKTAFSLMDNYSILLTSRNSLKSPPKKNKNNEKSLKNSISHLENETNIKIIQNNIQKSQKRLLFTHKKKRKNKISIYDKTQMNENNMNKKHLYH